MSYRELIMIDVKEMLRRRAAGQKVRQVARDTGLDRKTVGRYFEAAATLPLVLGQEVSDAHVHEVAQRVQARPQPDASAGRRPADPVVPSPPHCCTVLRAADRPTKSGRKADRPGVGSVAGRGAVAPGASS